METKDISKDTVMWFQDNGYLNSKGKDFLIELMKEGRK